MHKTAVYLPPLYQDSPDSGRLILRDGSIATMHVADPSNKEAIRAFFRTLSSESRYSRFFSVAGPDDKLLDFMCGQEPDSQLTLLVTRVVDGAPVVIAAGSYMRSDADTAEVAMAVQDAYQGLGIGTHLLERLALLAMRHRITKFWATTHSFNQRMIEIFRDSGFKFSEKREDGYITFDFSLTPTKESMKRSEMLDRVFTTASLQPFFKPGSIAVIGASRDPSSLGYRILEQLVMNRFHGPVYPVNPRASVIGSIHAYPSIMEIPQVVDMAIVCVPREFVLPVIDDCATKGVRAVVVITAGYAEVDSEGKELQSKLVEKVRGYGMRMVGPNCMGLINADPEIRMNASFSMVYPPSGRMAMSSQSGALGIAILSIARDRNLGVSTFISVGNKADVSGNDLLQYWEQDPATNVILLYLESFGNPRRFARIARRVSKSKPIIVVKSGRTSAGKRAAGSHTAALAASDVAVDALFHQTGVIRAETLEEMFDVAELLSNQPLPITGRVGIITNAGGPGILCADACEAGGLSVPELSAETRQRLMEMLPASASAGNPIDMIASATPEQYEHCVRTMMAAREIDSLIVIYIPVVSGAEAVFEAIRRGISAGRKNGDVTKTVVACLMAEEGQRITLETKTEKIATYRFPETAGRILGKASRYAQWVNATPGLIPDFDDMKIEEAQRICNDVVKKRGGGWLTVEESRKMLICAGLKPVPGQIATSADASAKAARELGFPVAVKLASHEIVHKTEIGGVALNLVDETAVRNYYEKLRAQLEAHGKLAAMDGVLIQPMLESGVEVMIGVAYDRSFGPMIAFGLGGIHVEILRDVSFRITPLTDRDASEMVRDIRGYRLLQGYRGHAAADVNALEEALLRVSRLVEQVPEIRDLDLNPIFAFEPGRGCIVADARIAVSAD